MYGKRSQRLLLISLLGTSLLVGCGQMPTAPVPGTSQVGVTSQATPPAAPSPLRAGQAVAPTGLLDGVGSVVGGLVGLIVKVLNLVGSVGGTLTNGRWKVVIPPNAVDGSAIVSLGVPSTTSPDCQLEITPATKNHFNVPVTLTVDCRSVPSDQLRQYVIYWYDPVSRTWTPVSGSRVDLVAKSVSAPLQHFSRYAVGPIGGRSGW